MGKKEDLLEIEKAKLISLALDFGFDQETATNALNRLVNLYGDEGRDFITVEHCGYDFLATLAESMQDTEDWDDLQNLESEACGTFSDIFDKDVLNNNKGGANGSEENYVNVVEESPGPQKQQNFMHLTSSSDSEDEEFKIPSKKAPDIPLLPPRGSARIAMSTPLVIQFHPVRTRTQPLGL